MKVRRSQELRICNSALQGNVLSRAGFSPLGSVKGQGDSSERRQPQEGGLQQLDPRGRSQRHSWYLRAPLSTLLEDLEGKGVGVGQK